MSPEDTKYYETYFGLFGSEGWKQFVNDITEANKIAKEGTHYSVTSDEFFIKKGNIQTLTYIENFEEVVNRNYESIAQAELEEVADAVL